ncbi:MAG: hypothetical protein ACE5FJ_03660 [Gemmatimonadales bacterium]
MLLRFLHFLSLMLWLGGAVAAMITASSVRHDSLELRARVYRILARIHALVIAPGAVVATLSGFLILASMYTAGVSDPLDSPRVVVMQAAGIIAALIVVAVALPTAHRRAAIAQLEESPEQTAVLAKLRVRQAVSSTTAGLLFVVALVAVEFLG